MSPRERSILRANYDAAELRLIAAIATRKALLQPIAYRDLTSGELTDLSAAVDAIKSRGEALDAARRACEEAGVVVNTHAAMPHL